MKISPVEHFETGHEESIEFKILEDSFYTFIARVNREEVPLCEIDKFQSRLQKYGNRVSDSTERDQIKNMLFFLDMYRRKEGDEDGFARFNINPFCREKRRYFRGEILYLELPRLNQEYSVFTLSDETKG